MENNQLNLGVKENLKHLKTKRFFEQKQLANKGIDDIQNLNTQIYFELQLVILRVKASQKIISFCRPLCFYKSIKDGYATL